jgi:cold shock CspA family protein
VDLAAPALPELALQRGEVVAYDASAGYGTIRGADAREWWFHCTAIADGSRLIAVGASGVFSLVPGRSGRWEAVGIVSC